MVEVATPSAPPSIAGQLGSVLFGNKPEEVKTETPEVKAPDPEVKTEIPEVKTEATEVKAPEIPKEEVKDDPFAWVASEKEEKKTYDDGTRKVFKEILGTDDIDTFLNSYKESQKVQEEFTRVKTEKERIEQDIKSLPAPLQLAIRAAAQGDQDWAKALKDAPTGLEWDKPADKQDKWGLIDNYYREKFTPEEREALKDGTAEESLKDKEKNYYELSKEKFSKYKGDRDQELTQAEQLTRKYQEEYAQGVEQSIAYAASKYKNVRAIIEAPAYKQGMLDGTLFQNVFYDQKGLPKPHAALAALIAANPEGFIASVRQQEQKAAREWAQLEQMNKTPDKPRTPVGGGGAPEEDANRPSDPMLQPYYDFFKSKGTKN